MKLFFSAFCILFSSILFAQDNSPYSRFGLGDLFIGGNTTTRGMGGISAGYADVLSINFNNPASYSQFQIAPEARSKKIAYGRAVFDIGTDFQSRTLIAPNKPERFTSNDLLFSYMQVGLPIKKNWGFSFGIRPVSRINYLINRDEYLMNGPNDTIERAITQFRGTGGSYLPNIGTGFAIKNVSFGISVGYLFGNRENTTLRSLVNDSILYYSSEHSTTASFGGVFFNAGIQYAATLKKDKSGDETVLRLGVSGNWKQTLGASQDVLRQTYTRGNSGEELRIDSVFEKKGIDGKIIYPSTYKAGFTLQHVNSNGSTWLFGADYTANKWSQYRYYGQVDSVKDNSSLNFGAQLAPRPQTNYFSHVTYRFGFFTGNDYVKVQNKLPLFGASFGMALPIRPTRFALNQYSIINIGMEYMKRGNDNNLLKENLFRFSLGLNLTDYWFIKKKYE